MRGPFPVPGRDRAEDLHRYGNDDGGDHHGKDDSPCKETVARRLGVQCLAKESHERHHHDHSPESIDDRGNGGHDINDHMRKSPETAMGIFKR